MTDEKSLTVVQDAAPDVWGDRQEIAAIGRRLKVMLPNGSRMTDEQAMGLAQYSRLVDANPFRGEVYALPGGGFVDGYKLLIRWAQSKAPYTDKYTIFSEAEKENEGLSPDDIAYRCYILRDDTKSTLLEFIRAGASFQEAYELVAKCASGVVTTRDMTDRDGKPINPPKGWTWHDVARKRALKNALNLSHGAPSPKELTAASWKVGNVQTRPEDWQDMPAEIAAHQETAEQYARLQALERERAAADEGMTIEQHQERQAQNADLLHGPADDTPIGEEPEETPETRFYKRVVKSIPYYKHANHVRNTLVKLELVYDPANEDDLADKLDQHARRRADDAASGAQLTIFETSQQNETAQ